LIGENKCRLIRKIIAIGVKLAVLQHTCGASAAIFHAKSVIGGFGLTTEVAGYSDERVYANTQTIITIVFAAQVSRTKLYIYYTIYTRTRFICCDQYVKLLQKHYRDDNSKGRN